MATGTWNNLGKTPAQPTSYCKLLQGWMGTKIRDIPYLGAELLTLDPLEDPTGTIEVIRLTGIEYDYYLIEARRKVGFDAYVPGEKVLVLYYNAGKLYLKATLSPGQSYRTSSLEVMVTKEDLENWSFQVYVAYKSWSSDKRLTSNAARSDANPLGRSVASVGSYVYVAWADYRNGNWEIYFKRSTDNGLTWGPDTRLTSNAAVSEAASVAAFGNNVYVAWEDNRAGNFDIFVKRSVDNGATWTQKTLTSNTADQRYPKIAAYGNDVHVVWADYRNAENVEIYYTRSLDSGTTYKPETRLTTATGESTYPSVAVKGKTVYVVWQDIRTEQWEIWFKDSPDRGVHWTADRILSTQPSISQWPSISISGDNVYVVWTDNRNRNYEIYFKYRW